MSDTTHNDQRQFLLVYKDKAGYDSSCLMMRTHIVILPGVAIQLEDRNTHTVKDLEPSTAYVYEVDPTSSKIMDRAIFVKGSSLINGKSEPIALLIEDVEQDEEWCHRLFDYIVKSFTDVYGDKDRTAMLVS